MTNALNPLLRTKSRRLVKIREVGADSDLVPEERKILVGICIGVSIDVWAGPTAFVWFYSNVLIRVTIEDDWDWLPLFGWKARRKATKTDDGESHFIFCALVIRSWSSLITSNTHSLVTVEERYEVFLSVAVSIVYVIYHTAWDYVFILSYAVGDS